MKEILEKVHWFQGKSTPTYHIEQNDHLRSLIEQYAFVLILKICML